MKLQMEPDDEDLTDLEKDTESMISMMKEIKNMQMASKDQP